MKKLIPFFCLFHMLAIFWWTLPYSFGGKELAGFRQGDTEYKILNTLALSDSPKLQAVLRHYIDFTGSQQYWDFFAPNSPRYHQYLSVCDGITNDNQSGSVRCQGKPLFSNLDTEFLVFGSHRSRFYRLAENLINLEDSQLFSAFTLFYQQRVALSDVGKASTFLVLHQFELHPENRDLPKEGYRMDKVLLAAPW